ncbi:MAG TPA: Ku protein [Candidatus Obscuribacterales bacterium]
MARAMWSGIISFGLVSIPIKLYKAKDSKGISFNQLHKKCHTRIQEKRWCPYCEEEVEWGDVVKGYQYSKDEYVILEEEDLAKLPLPSKNIVNVLAFVALDEVDPVYYDSSYYLEPDKVASKAYPLLLESLKDSNRVAIGTITLRNKERLCLLRPYGGMLMLETLLYPDEIRVEPSQSMSEGKPTRQELQMAEKLIELMDDKFEPEKYKDHYREALEELIEAKLSDKEIALPAKKPAGKVVDLMDALSESLSKIKEPRKEAPKEHKKPLKRKAARKTKEVAAKRTRAKKKRAS